MKDKQISSLVPLGVGIGMGALSLWAAIELFPFLVVGGAGYLVYQGMKNTHKEEQATWPENGQQQNSTSSSEN